MKSITWRCLAAALMLQLGLGWEAFSAANSNARSLAMGGAYLTLARGMEAPAWNPANLGLRNSPGFSLTLGSIGFQVENNGYSIADYNRYNGAFLTEDDKNEILERISSDGLQLAVRGGVQVLSLSAGRLALFVPFETATNLRFSEQFLELAFHGNPLDQTYDFSNNDGEAYAATGAGMAYGFPIRIGFFNELAAGVSVRYVYGIAHGEVLESSGLVSTTMEGVSGDGRVLLRHSQGGQGFAADWGAVARLNQRLTAGISLSNMFNSLKWNKKVTMREYGVTLEPVTVESLQNTDEDSIFDSYESEYDGEAYSAGVPAELRLGASYKLRRIVLAANLVQGFEERLGVSTKTQLSTGVELRLIGFLPLRAGVSFGGLSGFAFGTGLGLDFGGFDLDFGYGSSGSLPGEGMKGMAFGMGMSIGI